MVRRTPSGLTVVPAFRLVGYFAQEAMEQAPQDPLRFFHDRVRQYVRRLLAGMSASFIEIGERWAMTQIGDPNLTMLVRAVNVADKDSPRAAVEQTLRRCGEALPRPDLSVRIILLTGDGHSHVLTHTMQGVTGVSLGSQTTLLFFWPVPNWTQWLAYTMAHEYLHLVRNHLFPRGMLAGRMVYVKNEEPDTLLDAMVAEGLADTFARDLFPESQPRWLTALSPKNEAVVWPRVQRRLGLTDPQEIRRYLFGDNDRVPVWTGYAIGYAMVQAYLRRHPGTRPASLVGLTAQTIYQEGGYEPGEPGVEEPLA